MRVTGSPIHARIRCAVLPHVNIVAPDGHIHIVAFETMPLGINRVVK
jgi:hypothetical protein